MDSQNAEWQIDNLPNRLTLFRVLLIPVIITCLFISDQEFSAINHLDQILCHMAAWLFVLASITDFFDGYIARKRNIVTVFGSFLDPIADKLLVVSCLIFLQGMGRIPVLIVITLVLREMYITALRLLAAERNLVVPVGMLGKFKTATQMIAIPFLMLNDHSYGLPMNILGMIFITFSAIFSIYSALQYSFGLVKTLREQKIQKKAEVTPIKTQETNDNE